MLRTLIFSKIILFLTLSTSLVCLSCSEEEEINVSETDPMDTPQLSDPETPFTLVWSDEFVSAEVDTTKWSFMIGDGTEYGIVGWGNNELQYYTSREENVYIEEGTLIIQALKGGYENKQYTSARLRTKGKADWKYGKIEIRAQLPEGQGIWPAIWMLPTEEIYGGWPKSGEIDIMELVGHEPHKVHGTVHYGEDWPNNKFLGQAYTLREGNFSDDFHVFTIEWERNEIRFFVDENEFFKVTPDRISPYNYPFNQTFHLLLNIAVGGNWPGNPDATTTFPQHMLVDYVRVYQRE